MHARAFFLFLFLVRFPFLSVYQKLYKSRTSTYVVHENTTCFNMSNVLFYTTDNVDLKSCAELCDRQDNLQCVSVLSSDLRLVRPPTPALFELLPTSIHLFLIVYCSLLSYILEIKSAYQILFFFGSNTHPLLEVLSVRRSIEV